MNAPHPKVSFMSDEELGELAARLARMERLVVLLDYDGTLVPFASLPELAPPDAALLTLLSALAMRSSTEVHVVSGRDRETLQKWLGQLSLSLHAEHGFWSRERGTLTWTALHEIGDAWKARVQPVLEDFAARTPGAFVEKKSASLAWHYRLADPELGAQRARELRQAVSQCVSDAPLQVLPGNHVLEVRLEDANKGIIVSRVASLGTEQMGVVAVGDDATDEDMFNALPPGGVSIHVGEAASRAAFRVRDPSAVRRFLAALLETESQLISAGS